MGCCSRLLHRLILLLGLCKEKDHALHNPQTQQGFLAAF
jgi:hypothetical protein